MEGKSYLESREDMTRVYNDWRNTANAKTNDFEVRWDIKELAQERPWPSPDGSMSSRSRSSIIAATNETEAVAGNPAESEAITPRASNMAQYTPAYPENLEDFETATQFAVEPTPHASQGRFMTNHEIMSEIRAAYEHGLGTS
ncbi:hypothetical protein HKX48_000359 [Thoreauomyces humboldtii]|nr:hypothetical protein HKX48_000359 [Thoreauomyces humboldtii]